MKTSTAVLLTVVMAAIYAAGMTVATGIAENHDRIAPALQVPAAADAAEDVDVTIVTPHFDLEAASPARINDSGAQSTKEVDLAPTPDLTWYHPQGLEQFAGVS